MAQPQEGLLFLSTRIPNMDREIIITVTIHFNFEDTLTQWPEPDAFCLGTCSVPFSRLGLDLHSSNFLKEPILIQGICYLIMITSLKGLPGVKEGPGKFSSGAADCKGLSRFLCTSFPFFSAPPLSAFQT